MTGVPWNQGVSSRSSWTTQRKQLVQAGFKHWVMKNSSLDFRPVLLWKGAVFPVLWSSLMFQASGRLTQVLQVPSESLASSSTCPWPGCPLCCRVIFSPLSHCSSMTHWPAPLGGLWSFLNSIHTGKSQGNFHRLNIWVPSLQLNTHSLVDILTPKGTLLGVGAFGKWWGQEWVWRGLVPS